jgi:hypothetical protein
VPLLPASLIEPLWVEFASLTGESDRPEFSPTHPWGCHRRRVPDRVVFDHVIAALVHGSGYERLASPGVRTAPSVVGWPSGPRPGSPRSCCGSGSTPTTE